MSSSISILRRARRAIQSRPLLALSATSITSLTSYAYYVEYQTTTHASKYYSNDHSSSNSNDDNHHRTTNENVNKYILPKDYDREALVTFWNHRPLSIAHRLYSIVSEVLPFACSYMIDFHIKPSLLSTSASTTSNTTNTTTTEEKERQTLQTKYAKDLRTILTKLGPAFIKLGQQLSIRPDLLPAHVLFELQRLCDQVEPISDEQAKVVLRSELGDFIYLVDGNDTDTNTDNKQHLDGHEQHKIQIKDMKLVASASLGQVYKATRINPNTNTNTNTNTNMTTNNSNQPQTQPQKEQQIAIKIQRPEMKHKVSLDLYLLNNYGTFLDYIFTKTTNQIPFHESFINCFANGSYNELDYIKESYNQRYLKNELTLRGLSSIDKVYIPHVYDDMTTEKIITMDWVEGIKLADAPLEHVQELIPVGVELFLTQLLDIGYFHADPHPGNLYVVQRPQDTNDNGSNTKTITKPMLCLLDFGLCATIDPQSRHAMTGAIVHLLNGDYNTLINIDAKELGFLPHDLDISNTNIEPILTKILHKGLIESKSNLIDRKRNLMSISNELNQVFFEYPFSVPPFFALITRGLGLLEGIALSGDPNFDIFQASYPYASRRAAEIYGKHSLGLVKRSFWNWSSSSSSSTTTTITSSK